jgi:hypothetical protein
VRALSPAGCDDPDTVSLIAILRADAPLPGCEPADSGNDNVRSGDPADRPWHECQRLPQKNQRYGRDNVIAVDNP